MSALRVRGAEAGGFLHGILTQHMKEHEAGKARFAAMLTPQGKVLFDLEVVPEEDGVLLLIASDRLEALTAKLNMYKLRTPVAIEPTDLTVMEVLGGLPRWQEGEVGDLIVEGAVRITALWGRRHRVVGPEAAVAKLMDEIADQGGQELPALITASRIVDGIGTPGVDWQPEQALALELNLDQRNAVHFNKGCYVGQEMTARTHFRGNLKRRLMLVEGRGIPDKDGVVMAAGHEVGTLTSRVCLPDGRDIALGMLKLDAFEEGQPTPDVDGVPLKRLRAPYEIAHTL